jgi:hypothetical protein
MLVRDGSVGITHAIMAPRNTKLSDYHNHTDAWVWEETLFFGLGEHIRTQQWLPERDPVPDSLSVRYSVGGGLRHKTVNCAPHHLSMPLNLNHYHHTTEGTDFLWIGAECKAACVCLSCPSVCRRGC